MRIVVMGAGGVGGYFGARLARPGAPVTVVARGEHGKAMREAGLCAALAPHARGRSSATAPPDAN